MKKAKDLSFYVLLAGILLVAVSLFIVWRNYKKKYSVAEPEPGQDEAPEPEPEPEPAPEPAPAPEPGSQTPPFIDEKNNSNE